MAGYIGSKAVLLSTTAATVTGGADIAGGLTVDTNTLFVDSTNNNVGIGTTSPSAPLDVVSSGTTSETIAEFGNANISNGLTIQTNGNLDWGFNATNSRNLTLSTNQTERLRIDASGNVLVGSTSTSPALSNVVGTYISGANAGEVQFSGTNTPIRANLKGTDGNVINFMKDGTTVGSIGAATTSSVDFYVGGSSTSLRFRGDVLLPANQTGGFVDNLKDLGNISVRFDDIYATNGTIQTSDANEKQQIAELTTAEMQAAKAISKLFKTFKWNDSVAEKGDDARIHSGVIAQEVEAAMTAAGLDAGRYAFFISSTWWESTEVIPAVEEVLDEEGNVVTEAQAERTVTHQHETAEEAPTGAVERTRKGIRYPQLLAFVGAATEQRLASIEARLDALEAN